ncbi:MAG: 4-hydroxy-tetrahydrodipicolinate synthase [Candidatus Doudnabacteria bacterium]|nr:4-hydroxy-tetrahydrodipicolinate synthase [Candidatus Doudnabacteria bacterium]
MKRTFKGCGTAMVTPFDPDLSVDETVLRRMVNWQIAQGIDFLVPCGTTGESPTLSHDEQRRVTEIVIEEAAGRVPVIAGTGSNATAEAVSLTQHAKEAGADGCLVVTPYYNRPTQAGLLAHFRAIADVGLPVIVYNIPSRTGVDLLPPTLAELSEHPYIVGVKEATGKLDQMMTDIQLCGDRLTYLSGDDALTLPLISIGGHGVISVISNPMPRETVDMVYAALDGNWATARRINYQLFPLVQALFVETNPIPVKVVMSMRGLMEPVYRPPLCAPFFWSKR